MADDTYEAVLALLGNSASHTACAGAVERIDTHAARIFLVGADVYKIKRPIKLPYLDFSTVQRRRQALERELEINRENAPTLYIGLVPINRSEDGTLALNGQGEPVEWALHMRRFNQDDLLLEHVRKEGLSRELVGRLTDAVVASHIRAPVRHGLDGEKRIAAIVRQVRDAFQAAPDLVPPALSSRFGERAERELHRAARSLRMRSERDFVRRCHADLHLGNITLIDGQPVLFDALEFDEELATIDVLYDLAFLIMDIMHQGRRPAAQQLLDCYLHRTDAPATLYGLTALPIFLALRSAIRAVVAIDGLRRPPSEHQSLADAADQDVRNQILAYVHEALGYLSPPRARLVAVGGLSGTGKTTLAAALCHQIGAAPGALHLRTDVERKTLFGVDTLAPLGPEAYRPEVTAEVYASLIQKAKIALRSGHSVVIDAVFARPEERTAIAQAAERLKIPFVGLWLTAPADKMKHRVEQRRNDASDATVEIVERQLAYSTGPISWVAIDAGSVREETLREARRVLSLKLGALA